MAGLTLRAFALRAVLVLALCGASFFGGRWVEARENVVAAGSAVQEIMRQVGEDAKRDAAQAWRERVAMNRWYETQLEAAHDREQTAIASLSIAARAFDRAAASRESIAHALPTSADCSLGPDFVRVFNAAARGDPDAVAPAAPAGGVDIQGAGAADAADRTRRAASRRLGRSHRSGRLVDGRRAARSQARLSRPLVSRAALGPAGCGRVPWLARPPRRA